MIYDFNTDVLKKKQNTREETILLVYHLNGTIVLQT